MFPGIPTQGTPLHLVLVTASALMLIMLMQALMLIGPACRSSGVLCAVIAATNASAACTHNSEQREQSRSQRGFSGFLASGAMQGLPNGATRAASAPCTHVGEQ